MVAVQVFGNDHAVAFAGSQGNFQLNVYKPVILHNVLESIQLLAEAARSFNDRCAAGIEPNEKRIREHLDNSLMLVTALNPHIGYEKAAQISLKAYREDLTPARGRAQAGLPDRRAVRRMGAAGGHDPSPHPIFRRRKTINYRIGNERVPVANALRGVRGAAKMDLSRTPRNATEGVPYRRKSVTYCFTTPYHENTMKTAEKPRVTADTAGTADKPLTQRPAWKALVLHHQAISKLHLRELFAADPDRGERLTAEAAGLFLDYSKNRITDETLKLLLQLAEESGLRGASTPCSAARRSTSRRTAPCCTSPCARRGTRSIHRRRQECGARGPCGARQDGGLCRPRAQRRLEGPHRQTHPQRRQHRHRRLRPRAGDGLRGAEALQRARA